MKIKDVDINWESLGATFANLGDDKQAEFFKGLARELSNWDSDYKKELQFFAVSDNLEDRDKMMEINKVADYIIKQILAGGGELSNLKLHKLMYYVQAWHLAINDKPLFDGKFQAWIHGPVSRPLYDRFKEDKMLYSEMTENDIEADLSDMSIDEPEVQHIENVLEVYGGYSGTQLEIATHREDPWQEARKDYQPNERCEVEIDESLMKTFYRNRLEA